MDFGKSFGELQQVLRTLQYPGSQWENVAEGKYRLKQPQGVWVHFNEPKGHVHVSGNPRATKRLHLQLRALLNKNTDALAQPASVFTPLASTAPEEVSYSPVSVTNGLLMNRNIRHEKEYRTDVDSEIVIGLVATVGTNTDEVATIISERLKQFEYSTECIKISRDILAKFIETEGLSNFDRIDALMREGNRLRDKTSDCAILAKAAAGIISNARLKSAAKDATNTAKAEVGKGEHLPPLRRKAFIISSLKHPDEVQALRKIYSNGFFLLGIHASKTRRIAYLKEKQGIPEDFAKSLVERDEHELEDFGQQTRDTFHLSDFFINFDGDADKYDNEIWRIIDLIFGHPFVTPTFDEFAMFMAFSASLRSADLSRQVGAVVTRDSNILSTGANDVPRAGGGLHWAERTADGKKIDDTPQGRDYTRGVDANVQEKRRIIDDIVAKFAPEHRETAQKILEESKLQDITEYGRVAHAEMEALLACARNGTSTIDADLYCTTFPCHNCAKHIVASGVRRVVYVEPYPKSKALDFHDDSITFEKQNGEKDVRVLFEPFVGVGPRSFFNLFSTNLGSGYKLKRKEKSGKKISWEQREAKLRMQMLPSSYIEREAVSAKEATEKLGGVNEHKG